MQTTTTTKKKISMLNFKIDVFLKWPESWGQQNLLIKLKKNKSIFLLEDIEKNLEEYKKVVELRENQLAEGKKVLKRAKNIYYLLVK